MRSPGFELLVVPHGEPVFNHVFLHHTNFGPQLLVSSAELAKSLPVPGLHTRKKIVSDEQKHHVQISVKPAILARMRAAAIRGLRVLLIDDYVPLLDIMKDGLEDEGCSVSTATSGREGLMTFLQSRNRGEPFGVVITNLHMPGLDGRQVAAALKRESVPPLVMMLTGTAPDAEAGARLPPGVDVFVRKPVSINDLRPLLSRAAAAGANPSR